MSDTPQQEAEEVPGELASSCDQRTVVYPYTGRPQLRVFTAGRWRFAVVGSRHTYPDGRVSVSCEITLPGPDGTPGGYHRVWWWNPARMRVLWDGRSE